MRTTKYTATTLRNLQSRLYYLCAEIDKPKPDMAVLNTLHKVQDEVNELITKLKIGE